MESTLALIKPDAIDRSDDIIALIKQAGFKVVSREKMTLTSTRAQEFYAEHSSRSFYDDLIQYMTSGPIIAMVLRKEKAVSEWRALLGNTDPEKAKEENPESIRAKFGSSIEKNAAHGSADSEAAQKEIAYLFPELGVNGVDKPKEYLTKAVLSVLTKGLTEMCKVTPEDPVSWLGDYLKSAGKGKESKPKIVFVLGGPGSGKGTQCGRLVENFGFDHFSAGDLLRAEVKAGGERGELIAELIKEGKLVPGHITLELLNKAIQGSTASYILIDGFPRKLNQAGSFEKDVSDFEFVLFFDCPEEEMERRLLERGQTSGRTDDNTESIRKRFKTFVESSMPVIEYYEALGKVRRIEATKSIDDVYDIVRKCFE